MAPFHFRIPCFNASVYDDSKTTFGASHIFDGSQSTIIGDEPSKKDDMSSRLFQLRKLMKAEKLDYYIVPSEDAHQTEYVADVEKRRQFISGFTGSTAVAIIGIEDAYLVTDSRYWLQAERQLSSDWHLVRAGATDEATDWLDWIDLHVQKSTVGVDGRLVSYEKALSIIEILKDHDSKLVAMNHNLIDDLWTDKPKKSSSALFLQPVEYSGESTSSKLSKIRAWVETNYGAGTLITSLDAIAFLLNLRGSDVPFNPLFYSYLYIGPSSGTLFVDKKKVNQDVADYLQGLGIECKSYDDIWTFVKKCRKRKGKVIISPTSSYAISLMLTPSRYIVLSSYAVEMYSVKNDVEVEGLKKAYLRDGLSFTKFHAWLEEAIAEKGETITEYEAAEHLTKIRSSQEHYMGLAYENISASGPNAALPHYQADESSARVIDCETPYLNDSGGQYLDGTCDTTRTIHIGKPTLEQKDAYTRVLQGHIGLDSAIFPEGTSGRQLDALARKNLWKEGLNYLHGTGHGFGTFLTVHEGAHGFSSNIAFVPGHVVTNEPGYYEGGKWGVRIESALVVVRKKTTHEFNGPIWLGFERLTCVPIQTKMVIYENLSKDEKQWLIRHNQECLDKLSPFLQDDSRTLAWLKKQVSYM